MKQKSILSLYIALTLVVCFLCVGCGADKNLKKAEKYLALGEYYDAANEYKQAYRKNQLRKGIFHWSYWKPQF